MRKREREGNADAPERNKEVQADHRAPIRSAGPGDPDGKLYAQIEPDDGRNGRRRKRNARTKHPRDGVRRARERGANIQLQQPGYEHEVLYGKRVCGKRTVVGGLRRDGREQDGVRIHTRNEHRADGKVTERE